jgi:hypothetical protein
MESQHSRLIGASGKLFPLSLALCLLIPPAVSAAGGGVWWVFFTDRGPDAAERLASRGLELAGSSSWERRVSVGLLSADEYDLPPWEGYVGAVEAAVSSPVRVRSRYLNAVSVPCSPGDLDALRALPFVAAVRPVGHSSYAPAPPIPMPFGAGLSSAQLSQITLDSLHARGWTGSGIVMGVLDTGFDLDHAAFGGLDVIGQYDFLGGDPDPSQQPGDFPGQAEHGTKVLSVIGGFEEDVYHGGAYGASFLLAKTEDISDEYQEEEDYWVAGLEWVEENGALIVSSSLAYSDWYTWEDMDGNTAVTTIAADLAASRGTMVYNAIGNEGPAPGTLMAPSDGDSVFAAGAVDGAGLITTFSSRGPTFDGRTKPDACARGEGTVFVSWPGTSGYSSGSGTSFATPLLSSAAAVLADAHPEWTIFDIADALRCTASYASSPNDAYGWGIVDAYGALLRNSVTGSVRWSDSGEPIPGYPLSVEVGGGPPVTVQANGSGWFAVDPGALGPFTVSGAGGAGSVITVTGVLDSAGVEVPVYVDPLQSRTPPSVFPNPSMGGVYVGFDVTGGPADVTLSIHTLTGEAVYTEERRALPGGIYRAPVPGEAFHWDGTDGSGGEAASGIYLARLVTGGTVDVIEFALVR